MTDDGDDDDSLSQSIKCIQAGLVHAEAAPTLCFELMLGQSSLCSLLILLLLMCIVCEIMEKNSVGLSSE